MNQTIRPSASDATLSWRLWIDRCGGFGLFVGSRINIGSCHPDTAADIRVRADWRREEGSLQRRGGDYFWYPAAADGQREKGVPMRSGDCLPIVGSAELSLSIPSPLSATAVLSVAPPHRFDDHIDTALLVDETVLIGPESGHHIRCPALESSVVLVVRGGRVRAKLRPLGDRQPAGTETFCDIIPGQRVSLGDLDMTLEQV